MLVQGRRRPTYLLNSNLQIRLWYCRLGHTSNVRVIQVFKLVNEINLGEIIGPINNLHSSDSKFEFDSDSNKSFPINKKIELNIDSVEKLYEACIESKDTRNIKSKKITPPAKKLQEIHVNLWGRHNPTFISDKNYIVLLVDEFTRKSWIILLRSKDQFFDLFKF